MLYWTMERQRTLDGDSPHGERQATASLKTTQTYPNR